MAIPAWLRHRRERERHRRVQLETPKEKIKRVRKMLWNRHRRTCMVLEHVLSQHRLGRVGVTNENGHANWQPRIYLPLLSYDRDSDPSFYRHGL